MGMALRVKCKNCGEYYEIEEGGGFTFHLLHCDKCGSSKSVPFQDLGDIHLRYIKGLGGPYCIATAEQDKNIQENYPGDPIDEDEYHRLVEKFAGACECGGYFKFDAHARAICPNCGSTDYSDDIGIILYD